MEMRDRLIELIYCSGRNYDDYVDEQHEMGMSAHEDFDSWLADDIIADGWIRPPCKVGDTVWEVNTDNPFDEDLRVMEAKVERFFIGTSVDLHCMDCVGKTVFLTKEEAENALKGSIDNGNERN